MERRAEPITIDIESYQRKHGKPVGRAFWTFRIVAPTATFKDHIFTTVDSI